MPSGFTASMMMRLPSCSALTLRASASAWLPACRSMVSATCDLSQAITAIDPSKVLSEISALPVTVKLFSSLAVYWAASRSIEQAVLTHATMASSARRGRMECMGNSPQLFYEG